MDLIRDDQDIIFQADFSHPCQIPTRKDNSQRIVRIAQHEHADFLCLLFEQIPVNFIVQNIALHLFDKWHIDLGNPYIIFYLMKFIINRGLDKITFL